MSDSLVVIAHKGARAHTHTHTHTQIIAIKVWKEEVDVELVRVNAVLLVLWER